MADQTKAPRLETGTLTTEDAKRFAHKHGLTLAQAQALFTVIGDDLAKLTAAAARLKGLKTG